MISLVLTSYNYDSYLGRALRAVSEQKRLPDEIIIIDDASTDNSHEIIIEWEKQASIRTNVVWNKNNEGVIWSINHGLYVATHPYVLFATADDWIFPELIEESLACLKKYPEAGFCMASAAIIDDEGRHREFWECRIPLNKEFIGPDDARRRMLNTGFWFAGTTTVFNRSKLIAIGGFSQELGHYCDGFASQVLALKHGFCYIPRPLASIRFAQTSYSQLSKTRIVSELQLQKNVVHLMHTTYSNLFPDRFIREWDSVNKLLCGLYAWRAKVWQQQKYFLNNSLDYLRPRKNIWDKLSTLLINLISWSQFALVALYLIFVFGKGRLFRQYISFSRFVKWMFRLRNRPHHKIK